jgi:hypothetical protein
MTVEPVKDRTRELGRPVPQSADPIDRVVRLAPRWTVFVLLACALLVLGTIIWSVRGSVTTTVSTRGMYNERGTLNVLTTKAVTVDRVLVKLGQRVIKGEQVVTLKGGAAMVSPQDGMVTSILVSDGSMMLPGKASLQVTDLAQPDDVVAVVPASLTGTVAVGMPVRMEVSSAPSSKYGYLLGRVDTISRSPDTVEQIATRLGMEVPVVASLLGTEPALLATIRLESDASTSSDYRWSVGAGPDFVVTQGVPVRANIIMSEDHPLDMVFPDLRGNRR